MVVGIIVSPAEIGIMEETVVDVVAAAVPVATGIGISALNVAVIGSVVVVAVIETTTGVIARIVMTAIVAAGVVWSGIGLNHLLGSFASAKIGEFTLIRMMILHSSGIFVGMMTNRFSSAQMGFTL